MKFFRLVLCTYLLLISTSLLAKPLIPISPVEQNLRRQELLQSPLLVTPVESSPDVWDYCQYQTIDFSIWDDRHSQFRNLTVDLVLPAHSKKVPFMIVIPTIEGKGLLEEYISGKLCYNDFGVIIADVNRVEIPSVLPGLGSEDENNRLAIKALRNIVDYVETHPRLLPNQIGTMGLSLGGVTAGLLAGIEPRLKATVIAAGGGNLPAVLTYSDQKFVVDLRDQRMKAMGLFDLSQYEEVLRQSILFDPFYFADPSLRETLLMIMVDDDKKVPYDNQKELWRAFGKPERMIFQLGHVGSLLQLTFLYMNDVIAFLNKKFMIVPPLTTKTSLINQTTSVSLTGPHQNLDSGQ